MPRPRKVNDPRDRVRTWLHALARGDKTVLAMPAGAGRVREIMAWVDQRVADALLDAPLSGSLRDQIFDLLMARMDVFQSDRVAFCAVFDFLKETPCAAAALVPGLQRRMVRAVETALGKPAGVPQHLLAAGLIAVYMGTLRSWQQDDTPDMARTMATLDQYLSRAESLMNLVKKS